jgi:hypothetical protein
MTYTLTILILLGLIWLWRSNTKARHRDLWTIKDDRDYDTIDSQKLINAMRMRDD